VVVKRCGFIYVLRSVTKTFVHFIHLHNRHELPSNTSLMIFSQYWYQVIIGNKGRYVNNLPVFITTRLMALCLRLARWAGTRKVKPVWILLKVTGSVKPEISCAWRDIFFLLLETVSMWQWYQLGCLQVYTSLQTDNHAKTPTLECSYRPDAPSCLPTNSVKALKGSIVITRK